MQTLTSPSSIIVRRSVCGGVKALFLKDGRVGEEPLLSEEPFACGQERKFQASLSGHQQKATRRKWNTSRHTKSGGGLWYWPDALPVQ